MKGILPLLLLACSYRPAKAQQADSTKAIVAIRQLVKNYEDAWNRHDPAGLAANYDSNATWVFSYCSRAHPPHGRRPLPGPDI